MNASTTPVYGFSIDIKINSALLSVMNSFINMKGCIVLQIQKYEQKFD